MGSPTGLRCDLVDLNAGVALDRTARLINGDCFDSQLTHDEIIAGLLSTTVRVSADRVSLGSAAGQPSMRTKSGAGRTDESV